MSDVKEKLLQSLASRDINEIIDAIASSPTPAIAVALDDEHNTILHLAAKQGNVVLIKHLVGYDWPTPIDLNIQNENGFSPLHVAAIEEHTEAIEALLSCGANPLSKDGHGRTVIHWVAEKGLEDITIRMLSNLNTDVNTPDLFGRTVLHWAAKRKLQKLASYICSRPDVNINATTNGGETALHWASLEKSRDMIDILLRANADTLIRNHNGQTVADVTCDAAVKTLLEEKMKEAQEKRDKEDPYKVKGESSASTAFVKEVKPQQAAKKMKITLKKK
ncbi:ankyrin repeat protein [Planoprotostelium fungivorum]|uniref:Ankyrin repeat protein n=1 Tax=Planoprotostelium fungivorum TaxID=1890364 RepID=A0A2P6NIV8_9EUKA|nr:ankyrin repeat protein [Planoprotostelium fungivorum]